MAVLTSDTLTGCNSIPSFIGGTADTPGNPSVMVFYNTNAPPNWVKITSLTNYALRVIGGANGAALTSGGSVLFTNVFKSSYPGSVTSTPASVGTKSVTSNPGLEGVNPYTNSGTVVTLDPATLTNAQLPNHTHTYTTAPITNNNVTNSVGGAPTLFTFYRAIQTPLTTSTTTPSPAVHTHTISWPVGDTHTHTIATTQHTHTIQETNHNHFVSYNLNLDINYVDVILATKS